MELRKASIAVLCVLAALSVAEATLSKRDKKKKSKSSNKQVHDVYIDLLYRYIHVYYNYDTYIMSTCTPINF